MENKNGELVTELMLFDLKYLSVRKLYFDWFFTTGAETASQLIDGLVKFYLKRNDEQLMAKEIYSWHGNQSHDLVKILNYVINKKQLDFDISNNKDVLANLFRIYKNRYLDWNEISSNGNISTYIHDLKCIDYTYSYFRKRLQLNEAVLKNTLINEILEKGSILFGSENNKFDLALLLKTNNQYLSEFVVL